MENFKTGNILIILTIFSPQISYGATSDKFSEKTLYPSFFRTVPSDKWQVEAMVELLHQFNWNWVAVVGSDEEYGQQGVQEFSKSASTKSICVAYQGLIPVYSDAAPMIQTIIQNINDTKVRVVVVFALSKQAEVFFKEVSEVKNMCQTSVTLLLWNNYIKVPIFSRLLGRICNMYGLQAQVGPSIAKWPLSTISTGLVQLLDLRTRPRLLICSKTTQKCS